MAKISCQQIQDRDIQAMLKGRGLLTGPPVGAVKLRIMKNRWGSPVGPFSTAQFDSVCCAPAEIGEIVVSGQHVLPGYLHGRGDEETKFRVDDVGWHRTGSVRIASTEDRADEFRRYMDRAEALGLPAQWISAGEACDHWPLFERPDRITAAIWNPDDGHIAPADVTMSMAAGARALGAVGGGTAPGSGGVTHSSRKRPAPSRSSSSLARLTAPARGRPVRARRAPCRAPPPALRSPRRVRPAHRSRAPASTSRWPGRRGW